MIIPILALVVIVAGVSILVPSLNKVVFANKDGIPNVKTPEQSIQAVY